MIYLFVELVTVPASCCDVGSHGHEWVSCWVGPESTVGVDEVGWGVRVGLPAVVVATSGRMLGS